MTRRLRFLLAALIVGLVGLYPLLAPTPHRIDPAHFDLMRVARARRDIVSAAMADPDDRPTAGLTGPIAVPGEAGDPGADKRVATLSDVGARLARLDRYERGGLWRRKLAIRAFDVARRKAARRRRSDKV